MNSVGIRLKALRGNATQAFIAKQLGISPSSWAMYENGERMPRDEVKVQIAAYFNKTVQEIFFA